FYSDNRLVVGNSDINLELPATAIVNGRLVLDDGGQLPIMTSGVVRPNSAPVSVRMDGPENRTAELSSDGSFSLALRGGQYRVSLILPFGYYPKSFTFGTTDLLRAAMDLSRASSSEIWGIVTTSPPDEA